MISKGEKAMKIKQSRKNAHKEKITLLEQNKMDSDYIEKVRKKAYELYEKRGCQFGQEQNDWFEVEMILQPSVKIDNNSEIIS